MNEHIQKFAELAGFNIHNDLMDGHSFHHERRIQARSATLIN
jgi:hypothetical protein